MRTRFVWFVTRIVKQQGTADFHESNVDGGAKSQEAHNLNSIVMTIVLCALVRNTGSLVSPNVCHTVLASDCKHKSSVLSTIMRLRCCWMMPES